MNRTPAEGWKVPPEPEECRNGAPKPILARKLSELLRVTGEDPDELLKYRFLCRGGGLLLAGPTGIGKSAFALQCALLWAIGKPCFGITPARPIKSLFVQAENDDGDLAEMRDGILAGLDFTPVQQKTATESVIVCREDSRAGFAFFVECLKPLLAEHGPDLLWIDPALSYLGGESNSQKDVGAFLRNWLNPLLREFNCAAVVVHHTNKPPTGRERPDWAGSDFAYLGAGSAEWANWARAVLAIRAIGSHSIFELKAGKRGGRIGWKDANGETSYSRVLAHSKQAGVIYWREIEESEAPRGAGRPTEHNPAEILALLPPEGLATKEWSALAEEECGVAKRTFFKLRKTLESQGRVLKSKVNAKWQPVSQAKVQ